MLIGMIGYSVLIYLWYTNYSYAKNFDYRGETLSYKYSPFNNSFNKLFRKELGHLNNKSTNEYKQKHSIDIFLFLQCEHYNEEQNYTAKQKEAINNGSIKIIHGHTYSKGNLKEFIINAVKEDKLYFKKYKGYTKQSKVDIESIVDYRYLIFNIPKDE
jgi:hypothetical protein